jgi:hypothetical protein
MPKKGNEVIVILGMTTPFAIRDSEKYVSREEGGICSGSRV